VLRTAKGNLMYDSESRACIDFLAEAGSLNYEHNDLNKKAPLMDHIGGARPPRALPYTPRPISGPSTSPPWSAAAEFESESESESESEGE
jgi:hypothetical protein